MVAKEASYSETNTRDPSPHDAHTTPTATLGIVRRFLRRSQYLKKENHKHVNTADKYFMNRGTYNNKHHRLRKKKTKEERKEKVALSPLPKIPFPCGTKHEDLRDESIYKPASGAGFRERECVEKVYPGSNMHATGDQHFARLSQG